MGDFGKVMEDQFLSLLAYVAEQERKKNRQRQAEGIEVARADALYSVGPSRKSTGNLWKRIGNGKLAKLPRQRLCIGSV